jgi:phage-related protein
MINRKFFFDQVRNTLFGGSLKQSQVSGLTAILDEWDANTTKQTAPCSQLKSMVRARAVNMVPIPK